MIAAGSRWGTNTGFGMTNSSSGNSSTNYRDMLTKLIDTLKPGGEVEKAQIAEAEQEGKQLSAQLNAASIAKGLGNATNNAPVAAMKHVAKRKTEIRGSMLQQLMQTMQFLANMNFQEEQNAANRAQSYELNRKPTNAERGLDAFGQPMSGGFNSYFGQTNTGDGGGFTASAYPSLASAGGMTAKAQPAANPIAEVFGDSTSSGYTPPKVKFGDVIWGGRDDISDLADKYTLSEKEANKRKW